MAISPQRVIRCYFRFDQIQDGGHDMIWHGRRIRQEASDVAFCQTTLALVLYSSYWSGLTVCHGPATEVAHRRSQCDYWAVYWAVSVTTWSVVECTAL